MRKLMIAGVAGAVLLLATAGALAGNRDQLVKPTLPRVSEGQVYDRSDIFPHPDGPPVSLPTPVEPSSSTEGNTDQLLNMTGPMGFDDYGATGALGSGFVTPRGSTMSTPRMRADREIRRLINRLN